MIALTFGEIMWLIVLLIIVVLLPFIIIGIKHINSQIEDTNLDIQDLIHHLDDTTQATTRLLQDLHSDNQQIQPSLKAIGTIGDNVQKLNNTLQQKHKKFKNFWNKIKNKSEK